MSSKPTIMIPGSEKGVRVESRVLEERVQRAVADGHRHIEIIAQGQHGIGGRLWRAGAEKISLRVLGTSGQRVGAMGFPGTLIDVVGPASDDVGWLNAGAQITIRGNATNGAGNAMAQGKIYVAGDIGARGMTMTKHNPRFEPPELWVLGTVGDSFAEFMAGGVAEKVNVEKKKIQNAGAGLLLAVSSYVLLYTINPNLVEFKSLRVQYVENVPMEFDSLPTDPMTEAERNTIIEATAGNTSKYNYKIYDYKQYHDPWANNPYGCDNNPYKNDQEKAQKKMNYTIWHQGCYFTSIVNILNTFYPGAGNPGEVLNFFHQNSAIGRGCKTENIMPALFNQSWLQKRFPGIKAKIKTRIGAQQFVDELNSGNLIVACSTKSALTSKGHCISVYDYFTKNGKIYLKTADPGTNGSRCAVDELGTSLGKDAEIQSKLRQDACGKGTKMENCLTCGGTIRFGPDEYPLDYLVKANTYALILSKK